MGLGFVGAYGAAGGASVLRQALQDRLVREQLEETKRRNQADESLRRQSLETSAEIKRQAQEDRAQRQRELAQAHEDTVLARQVPMLRRGTLLTPEQHARFDKAGYGPMFSQQEAQPALPDDFQGPLPEGQTREAMPGGFRFEGSSTQDLAELRDETNRARIESQREIEAARAEARAAREDATRAYRDASLGLRERALNERTSPPDDPTLPSPVGDFLLSLRQKHGDDLDAAFTELNSLWANVRKQYPRTDAVKAGAALRQLFAQPYGAGSRGLDLGDILGGGGVLRGRLTAPEGAPSPAQGVVRGQLRVTGSTAPSAPASSYQAGQQVRLRDGRTVTITRVFPDGTYEVE